MLQRVLIVLVTVALVALSQAPQGQAPQGQGAPQGKAAAKGKGGAGKGRGGGPVPVQEKAKLLQPPQVMQLVRPGLYMIANRGGNVLVRTTGEGLIVVDTKLPGSFDRLMEIIRGISREPVKYVFNTHHHIEQTGNNVFFLQAGAQVIAPLELKNTIDTLESDPKPAAPNVTFVAEHTVKLGSLEVRAYHFGPGHTRGDAVVYFPADRVIALGGLLGRATEPDIDTAGGGSATGLLTSLAATLKLDWDIAIPSDGPPQRREEVEAYRKRLP